MVIKVAVFFLFAFKAYSFDHQHSKYSDVLKQFVVKQKQQTLVKYEQLKKNSSSLDDYILDIQHVTEKEYKSWDKNQKLAFLINAYNALTLKLIINSYPLESIKEIGNWLTGNAWKKKFFRLFGKKQHLDHIEHELIRKHFKEPRIHFALVCASIGCPNLKQKPYLPTKLQSQLEAASVEFLHNPQKNKVNPGEKTLYLSQIFKWYGGDFGPNKNDFLHFIAPRITNEPSLQREISHYPYKIKWLDYSWKLNQP